MWQHLIGVPDIKSATLKAELEGKLAADNVPRDHKPYIDAALPLVLTMALRAMDGAGSVKIILADEGNMEITVYSGPRDRPTPLCAEVLMLSREQVRALTTPSRMGSKRAIVKAASPAAAVASLPVAAKPKAPPTSPPKPKVLTKAPTTPVQRR